MSQENAFIFHSTGLTHRTIIGKSGEKRYFVKGHVTSGDLDLVDDIITKGCREDINEQFKSRNIKLDFDHETIRPDDSQSEDEAKFNLTRIVLGKATDISLDSKGNVIEFELNPEWKKFDASGNVVMSFKSLWGQIINKFYDAFSIAYVPIKTASTSVEDRIARLLDRVNILNVALTGNPINPAATMTSVMAKSLDYLKKKEGDKLEGKAYDPDGGHSHEGDDPIGKHNHPEIEKVLQQELRWLEDRISRLSDRINESPGEDNVLGKGDEDEEDSDDDDKKKKDSKKYKKKGGHMTEDEKNKIAGKSGEEGEEGAGDDVTPPAGEGESQGGEEGSDAGSEGSEGEAGDGEAGVDQKSAVDKEILSMKSRMDSLEKENKELKQILEKARPSGQGAPDKAAAQKEDEKIMAKASESKGPLDML